MATRKTKPAAKRKPKAHEMAEDRRGTPVERLSIVDSDRTPTGRFWFLPYYDPKGSITEAQRAAFKVMMRHPTIKAALLKKTLAVASQPWQLQLVDKKDPKQQEFGDFLRHMIDRLPEGMPGLMQSTTLPRLIDGYQAAEKVRTPEWDEPRWRGKIVYEDIRAKPTEMYEPDVDAFARVVGIKGRGPNDGEWWPLEDFFWTRHLPVYDNPLGTSDLAAAYSAWWMQDTVTKLRAIHAEKFTSPMLVAECEDVHGTVVDAALERARSKSWLRVPTGVKVQALEFAQKASADVFKEFIDDCDRKMMLGINGAYLQSLEGQVADGRGSASVSMTVSELFEWWLGAVFCHAIKKQAFREMRDKNFPGVPVPSLTLGGISEDEITKILANFASAQALGFELSRSEVAERTSLQEAKDSADKLVPRMITGGFGSPFGAPTPGQGGGQSPAGEPKEADLLNTVGGATSLTGMQTSYYAGELPREAAIQAAITVYGMARPEAEKLFPAQAPKPLTQPEPKPLAFAEHKFSSTQLDLEGKAGERILLLARSIDPADLAEDGIETEPHVTVKYGLETDDVARVQKAVHDFGPVTLAFDRPSLFPAKDGYEVLKLNVKSPELHRLNAAIADAVPHTDTHPTYCPHATIAYVKAGRGQEYVDRFAAMEPIPPVVATRLVFSDRNRKRSIIPLSCLAAAFADIPRDEVALAGPDGKQAAKLLGQAKDGGARTLYYLARRAVARLLDSPNPLAVPHLFDDAELIALIDSLAKTNATANLLGRARVRERAEQAQYREQGVMRYSDDDCFAMFADAPPQVLPPQQAVGYFQGLVPSLAVRPETFGPMLRREAFTLAAGTDEVMLGKVKAVISETLATGNTSGRVAEIDAILDRAGVGVRNPQYAEMVFRSNMMDSFNQGAMQELQSEDMKEFFPVWQYLGIPDSRQGSDHRPHNDKYYPNTTNFAEVRGDRIYNCRCSFRPVDKYEWAELQKGGKALETSW